MKKPERVRVKSLKNAVAVVIRIPQPLREDLMAEKRRTGKTLNLIVREAIALWLERNGRK